MDSIQPSTDNSLDSSSSRVSSSDSSTTLENNNKEVKSKDVELNEKGIELTDVTIDTEVIWVHWDGEEDPNNPLNWDRGRKWRICSIGIGFCGLVSLSVSSYAISQGSVIIDLNTTKELAILGITLFTVMFGSAPLVLAPLSEVYGRSTIYVYSSIVYALFFIPQALAKNIETVLVCRFISGIAGSSAVSLVGGTISDTWSREERGLPMAVFAFSAFSATGLGPLSTSYIEEYLGFRIISWILFAISTIFAILLIFFSEETRASVLLSRKAAALRLSTGDMRYQSKGDAEMSSIILMMKTSISRPIKMLFTEYVLAAVTIFITFAWSCLYILLESIPIVFGGVYGFSIGQSGLVFAAQVIGSLIGLVIDHYCTKRYLRTVAKYGPEARIYQGMVGGILLPVGGFIYALTAYSYVHWIFPCIGITILYCGLYLMYLSVFSYVAEIYTLYAASALSAQSWARNFVGAFFPLFTANIYDRLGIQGAGSLVSGIALILAAIPFILFVYGSKLRAKSHFAKEQAKREAEGRLD